MRHVPDDASAKFEGVLAQYGPALTRLAGGYALDDGDRDDLLQEILLALWGALPRFRGDCSERTFVLRVAHNRCMGHLRRRHRRPLELREGMDAPDPRLDPLERAEANDRHRRLFEAVRRLPPLHRETVILHLEGLSHREIGDVVGATENNIGVRLNRARAHLKRLLGEMREDG